MAEICAGTVTIGSVPYTPVSGSAGAWNKTLTNLYSVTFPKTFSKVPLVILSDATNGNAANPRYASVKPFVYYSGSEITTTGFKVRCTNYSGSAKTVTISYIAIVPFQELTDTTDTTKTARKTKGSLKMPKAIASGESLKLSDDLYWSLEAIHDNRTTSSSLHDTYYTFDYGTIGARTLNANTVTEVGITFNKKFAETPVVIGSFMNPGNN